MPTIANASGEQIQALKTQTAFIFKSNRRSRRKKNCFGLDYGQNATIESNSGTLFFARRPKIKILRLDFTKASHGALPAEMRSLCG
jgi:hypothetical protein